MDKRITELTSEASGLQKEISKLDAELTTVSNQLTLEETKQRLTNVDAEIKQGKERLIAIKDQSGAVTPEEKDRILADRTKHVREWRKRKRLAVDACDAILEHYPKSKRDFFEEVGIETDEDHGVVLPKI